MGRQTLIPVTIAILAAAGLAACGQTETANDSEVAVRSESQDRLFELSAMNRNIAMRRAITGAGFPCSRVDYSGFVGTYENLDQWTAMCSDGRQWALFIGPDDTVQPRYCPDVEKAGLPACEITRLDTREEVDVDDTADG